jgi:hypothetical protein
MLDLRQRYPKLDMAERVIREFAHPPKSPDECIFAMTTQTMSADLETMITPCQFGGTPDCSRCGCMASMGLAAVGAYKIAGVIPVGGIFKASHKIGQMRARARGRKSAPKPPAQNPLPILQTKSATAPRADAKSASA